MNIKLILFCSISLGLTGIGCKHTIPQQLPEKAGKVPKITAGKDTTVVQQIANDAARILAKPEVPVLCYHRISDGTKSDYRVSPATFRSQIKILADSGYHTISPSQLYDYLVYNKSLPPKPIMISFDDSRAEHSLIAAPVLEQYGYRGVFFIMTITYNKVNYMTTGQIAGLAKAGHTIGLHSWDHTMVTKYKDESDWQKEVTAPKQKLEKIVERKVDYWAYPDGVYDHNSTEVLSKYFKLSFILATRRDLTRPLQTIRRIIVTESTPQSLLRTIHRTFEKKRY